MRIRLRRGSPGRSAGNDTRESGSERSRRLRIRGLNALLGALLVASLLWLYPPFKPAERYEYRVGDVTQTGEEVIAPVSFSVPIDPEQLERERAAASLGVPPVYRHDRGVAHQMRRNLAKLKQDLEAVQALDSLETLDQRTDRLQGLYPGLEREAIRTLLEREGELPILATVSTTVDSFIARGILDTGLPIDQSRLDEPSINLLLPGEERRLAASRMVDQEELTRLLEEETRRRDGWDAEVRHALQSLTRAHLRPNYRHDEEETARRRRLMAEKVTDHIVIARGVRILGPNVQVTQDHLDKLAALEREQGLQRLDPWHLTGLYLGRAVLLVFILFLAARFLLLYLEAFFDENRQVLLLSILLLVFFAASRYALPMEGGAYLLPITFVAMIVAGLYDAVLAILVTILALTLLGAAGAPPLPGLIVAMLAGGAAIFSIRQIRSRLQLYKSVLYVAVAYLLGIVSVHLGTGEIEGVFYNSMKGMANGLVCAWLVMPILPLLERFFDLTTNFTLLELTDLNRPILKRMKVEAPGTFQHSLAVSNLAEAAADAIGANALLAKVCAYYHDIGKLAKPGYFGENVLGFKSRHDKLKPNMSALIIGAHVKEGLDLAESIKLPSIVSKGIPEHHGTTVMRYFYHKAREQDPHGQVTDNDFRYPGPKPQSAETAILMLADTVEATVRSLDQPSAGKIRGVVSESIEKRLSDGELEECGLSIADLAEIRESFITTLLSIYHPRIQYPAERDPEAERSEPETGSPPPEPRESELKEEGRDEPHAPDGPAESEVSKGV